MRIIYACIMIIMLALGASGDGLTLDKNQEVDPANLRTYGLDELILYRNSLFARYGYDFKSGMLRDYFLSLGWYTPVKNFSFTMLSKIDQRNVNAILAEETRKVAALKSGLVEKRYGDARYYLIMKEKNRVPASTETEMRNFWEKNVAAFVLPEIHVPVMLSAECADEKDADFIKSRTGYCRASFSYWEASYDGKAALRKLRNCSCGDGSPLDCNDTYYFDEKGNLVLLQGGVRGTTVNYEYYYQYCLDRVAWIELTLINGSAGSVNKTEKFFY